MTINQNLQEVQRALNVIDIMEANTQAQIIAINAEAQAKAAVIIANATADALILNQVRRCLCGVGVA